VREPLPFKKKIMVFDDWLTCKKMRVDYGESQV